MDCQEKKDHLEQFIGGWLSLGTALAGLLSGLIMYYVGFSADAATQPDGSFNGIKNCIFFTIPIIGTLIAIYVMRDYEINEERAAEIRTQLQERKGEMN